MKLIISVNLINIFLVLYFFGAVLGLLIKIVTQGAIAPLINKDKLTYHRVSVQVFKHLVSHNLVL